MIYRYAECRLPQRLAVLHHIASGQLRFSAGDILYKLKEAWNDGTIGIQLSPSELIEKLIALIPPRRSPLVRYGGVFAPNFKRRDEVILAPCRRKRKVSLRPPDTEKSPKSKVTSGSWARLLKRVLTIEVSRCPRCGADLEIIAAVLDPIQIARYIKHTGMPAAAPARAGTKCGSCVMNGAEGAEIEPAWIERFSKWIKTGQSPQKPGSEAG